MPSDACFDRAILNRALIVSLVVIVPSKSSMKALLGDCAFVVMFRVEVGNIGMRFR